MSGAPHNGGEVDTPSEYDFAALRTLISRDLQEGRDTREPEARSGSGYIGFTLPAGAAGSAAQAVTVPMWTVADIDAAVAGVREAGGTVLQQPSRQDYGFMAECTDDQGVRFYLGQV